jgi:D-hydroxyproline dehydrogenase subunit beta
MKTYDLAIVGGGILGIAHAYHAAKNNQKVLIIEKDNFAIGSSVRNFGQIVPSGLSKQWFNKGLLATQIYKEIQAQGDISVRKNGSIYIASNLEEWQLLNELYAYYQNKNYPCFLYSKRQCLDNYPDLKSDYVYGGLFFSEEISVEPNMLVYRLMAFIEEKFNVDFYPNITVVDCHQSANFVSIKASNSALFIAKNVLVCNGFHFNLLYPSVFKDSGLIISKLQMLQTAPMLKINLKGNILTGLTIRRYEAFQELSSYQNLSMPAHYEELQKWGIHLLFKQAIDGSMIIGDSHEYTSCNAIDTLGYESKSEINALILKEAQRILNVQKLEITKFWNGIYSQHPNGIFEYNIDTNINICTGIGGKGMTTSLGYAAENLVRLGILD